MAESATRVRRRAARNGTAANDTLTQDQLRRAYCWMATARRIDETMWLLRRQGKGHFVVSNQGHEAVGAAVGLAVDPARDFIAPHYRDLAAILAFGLTPPEVMAHYFGRAADPCTGGRQPYAHWGSKSRHIISQEGPQPNVVTHGVGVAYAARVQRQEAVVWIAFGDGGAQKGEVHEAMNFAGIHKLPVVFCAQNNYYTQSVPIRKESSVRDLSLRAQGYGMPGVSVDGMDLRAIAPVVREAVERARAGEGPSLVEARVYRYMPNTSNDDDTRYRSREEVQEARSRDPLPRTRALLVERGIAEEEIAALEREVADEVAAATAWAEAQPDDQPEAALRHTWADRQVPNLWLAEGSQAW